MEMNTLSDISLDEIEYCYLVGDQYHGNSSFKVRFPKLMPRTPGGKQTSVNTRIDKTVLKNDKDTIPNTIMGSIKIQNFITVKRSANCSLIHLADEYGIIKAGTRLRAQCTSRNIKDAVIIDG